MKQKLLTLLSMLLLASLALTACGGAAATEAPAPEEPAAPAPAPTEEPAATEEPMAAFEGMMAEAPNCDYGGEIKSIEAVDEFTVKISLCVPDPAFPSKIAFTKY